MTDPDGPPTDPNTDAAMMSTAHTLRTYHLALIAEGFQPHEALTLVLGYQTNLMHVAAMNLADQ